MAADEVNGQPSQPQSLNYKTWFLRVSVHCEGCKKKVKKILSQIPGVHTIDIDIRQQRVIVNGNVEADTLIWKLLKSGKNAELWPEQPMQKEKKPPGKSKYREEQEPHHHNQESQKDKEVPRVKKQQPSGENKEANSPVKIEAFKKTSTKKSEEKIDDFDVNVKQKSKENDDCVGMADKAVESNFIDSGGDNQEKKQSKSEGKTIKSCSAASQPLPVAEKSGGARDDICHGEKSGDGSGGRGGAGGSGKKVKKNKSKGQNGDFTSKAGGATTSSSADRPANMEYNGGPPISLISANQSPPHHFNHHQPHHSPHGSHHYGPLPPPSYGLSYNTSYPTNTHMTSYYTPSSPANAYAYSYPGPDQYPPPPPPSYPNSYPSQSLESFEMFSDENPNGCLVM